MPPEDDRLRELKVDIREMRDEFRHGIEELRRAIGALPVVRKDVYDANRAADEGARRALEAIVKSQADAQDARIVLLESFNVWLIRLVIGAVITGSVALLFAINR